MRSTLAAPTLSNVAATARPGTLAARIGLRSAANEVATAAKLAPDTVLPVRSMSMSIDPLTLIVKLVLVPSCVLMAAVTAARAPAHGRRLWLYPAGVLAIVLMNEPGSVGSPMSACSVRSISVDDCVTNAGANLGDVGIIERLGKSSRLTTAPPLSWMTARLNVSSGFVVL